MASFIFLRHGEYLQPKMVPSAHLPHPLSQQGIISSENSVKKILHIFQFYHLKFSPIIYTSSLLRAFQTGTIIAKNLIVDHYPSIKKLTQLDTLSERSLGNFSNLTLNEIQNILKNDPRHKNLPTNWKSIHDYKLPGIGTESLTDAGKRVFNVINEIVDSIDEKQTVIIVGHGASFRHAFFNQEGENKDDINKFSMHNAEPMLFNCHNRKWTLIHGKWKIRNMEISND